MKIQYKNWQPNAATKVTLDFVNEILEDYDRQGYRLTLRQLYYQLVSKNYIANTMKEYKRLSSLVTNARLAGLVSWASIEDRERQASTIWTAESPVALLDTLPSLVSFDQWARQKHHIEVWVEKKALGNVVERACDPLQVSYTACKGYMSSTAIWEAGRRIVSAQEAGKEAVIIHLGDHDPSGLDMTRDNRSRLELFTYDHPKVEVRRIALNMDQIDEYKPPANPAKLSDSRAKDYIKEYGNVSWELDALTPSVLEKLINTTINEYIDASTWRKTLKKQNKVKRKLEKISEKWDIVEPLLKG